MSEGGDTWTPDSGWAARTAAAKQLSVLEGCPHRPAHSDPVVCEWITAETGRPLRDDVAATLTGSARLLGIERAAEDGWHSSEVLDRFGELVTDDERAAWRRGAARRQENAVAEWGLHVQPNSSPRTPEVPEPRRD